MIKGSDFNKYAKITFTADHEGYKKNDEKALDEDAVILSGDEYKQLIPRFQPGKKLSDTDKIKAKELHSKGFSLREIGRRLNVSHQAIKRALDEMK